jgi:hypothetical protein
MPRDPYRRPKTARQFEVAERYEELLLRRARRGLLLAHGLWPLVAAPALVVIGQVEAAGAAIAASASATTALAVRERLSRGQQAKSDGGETGSASRTPNGTPASGSEAVLRGP